MDKMEVSGTFDSGSIPDMTTRLCSSMDRIGVS